jgi:Cys-tRNA(Pro)/Cys-tRNA(Cys) deacylase
LAAKLNSMRLLEKHKVPYEVSEFPDTERDAEMIAGILGVPAHTVYKTLVVEPVGGGKPFLAVIAADRQLDLKKMAVASGYKKVSMAAHTDAEKQTGLKVGGISALALTHKNWSVYLDQAAIEMEYILVSAGQRGMDLRLPTEDFVRILNAKVADITTG